ncbi:MAG TPA: dihydrolipoamide dehydrogenase [Hyphomonas atlantica]|uniref:Dihydrolipoamide dehydrogenase n=1 Tax=Hyphomonas atlantica TaxID=1280948 RepID=A0A356W9G9_9PROT|nr:dihydrolipoamide dehydrogenase [Hyphomonas atlantica]
MREMKADLVVIGAGSAGLSAAAGAAQFGLSVVLYEKGEMGGDCLNTGCVPSKALLSAAKAAAQIREAGKFGIETTPPRVDWEKVKLHVRTAIATIAPVDSQERFEGLGCTVIREHAKFAAPDTIISPTTRVKARRIVIATGSRAFIPPIEGLAKTPYLTNETLFDLPDFPEHLVILGGGPIGMEMAQAHRRLGCAVTVIEGAKVLGNDDPEMAAVVIDQFRAEGIQIEEGAMAAEIRGQAGAIEIHAKDGRVFKGSHLLMAVGRKANTGRLNLDAAGIETTKRGIKVDASMRTTNRRVYAIGDVAGGLQFTHVAGYHAGLIIRQALLGLPAKMRSDHIPWATYTDPELAQVGQTEAQARQEHGGNLEVVRFHYNHNDRAIAERKTAGLIKVMVVRGRPVGVSIAGAQAGELINLWALVLANGLKMKHVANMVAPYPTLGEINKRAAGAYFSPRLFDSAGVKRIVGFVQRWLP